MSLERTLLAAVLPYLLFQVMLPPTSQMDSLLHSCPDGGKGLWASWGLPQPLHWQPQRLSLNPSQAMRFPAQENLHWLATAKGKHPKLHSWSLKTWSKLPFQSHHPSTRKADALRLLSLVLGTSYMSRLSCTLYLQRPSTPLLGIF